MIIGRYKKEALAVLAAVIISASGCGNEGIEDSFVFGKTRVHYDRDTITLEAPFELGVDRRASDLSSIGPSLAAVGANKNIQILVSGKKVSDGWTVSAVKEDALSMITEDSRHISNLNAKTKQVMMGDIPAEELQFSFTETGRAEPADLTVVEYIFQSGHTIWRVIYQYRTHDPVGQSLTNRIAGHITEGTTF